jgi:hypothetical protein
MSLDEFAESWSLSNALGASVDHLVPALIVFGPVGNQAPTQHGSVSDGEFPMLPDDGNLLAGRDVVARRQLNLVLDLKALEKALRTG